MGMEFDVASIERAFVEAALDPTKWNEAMNAATIATGCTGAVLFDTGNHLPGLPHSESMVRSLEAYVEGGWIDRDVRYGVLSTLVQRGVATDFDIFTPDSISRHPYYQEFLAPNGLQWFAGVKVASSDSLWCLALQRSPSLGPFTPAQLHSLVSLSGRLGTACAITRTLGLGRIDAALEAFDMSMTAAIIFDGCGNVLRLNAAAERIVNEPARDETCPTITVRAKRLYSYDTSASRLFEMALAQVILRKDTTFADPIRLPRQDRVPILAYVTSLASIAFNPLAPGQAVAILIDPDERRSPTQACLQKCFSLTPSESKLAQKLAMGLSLDDVSRECCISHETARNHLKAIFGKTNTHRQSELVAVLSQFGQTRPAN
ncbi:MULTISPECIES: helix-turn-helix transcriptional regulator [unclassified Rhizobium]|uniref:helix-turn-helix transcriptional regulator n=1 Tax=unclassified Rhizobium TaxID=2613769 RepID=UPI00146E7405|nr:MULTISPECIES: helix-turn-helix transcriptional regulator [unclassified Rhizobium]MBD9454857.1 helix-turn-helix transcriptional regulator [Rhizobium sp. RHZ02]NMN73424.1 DNA-binding CsgD family transcriptional regulator [Rhizobium sp. 57MFTsu3.2]